MLAQYALGLLLHSRIITPQSYRSAKILRISSIIEKVFTSKIINHVRVLYIFPLCLVPHSFAYLTLIMFSFIHPKRAVRLVIALWEQFSLLAIRLTYSDDESHQNVNYVIYAYICLQHQ